MTLRRLRRQIYMSNSTTFDDQGLPQIIRDYQEPLEADQFNYGVNLSYQYQGNETTAGANLTERAGCDSEWQL